MILPPLSANCPAPLTSLTQPATRPGRRALARQSPAKLAQRATEQAERLASQIMRQGAAQAAAAAAAAALTKPYLTDAEVRAWRDDLMARLETILQHPEQNLGHIEEEAARQAKELMRVAAERAAQAKANATAAQCRQCQHELTHQKSLSRTISSRFGPLTIWRRYGWCPACQHWQFPADHALGLAHKAPASPYLQEISALLVSKMPPEQALPVAARLGLDLSRCFLDREAHRQGLKAEQARAQTLAQLDTWAGLQQLAPATDGPPLQPFTLVIEIDAWNIRERDAWGQTDALRQQGQKPERWHWVYTGTVFRLDHRGQSAGQRALITQRGFVATRLGLDAFIAQLHREAIQRGLGQAEQVLVIADGAVWIWRLAADRFPGASQRLDLWHGAEHLWAIADDLYGQGTPEARAWVAPLLKQLRDDQTPALITTLTQLQPTLDQALQKKLPTQIAYFENHAHRMQYKQILAARAAVKEGTATAQQIKLANQPLGSGAVEATCRQYQCRFKRTGQFWSLEGDEALLSLETLWRNGRWHQLYPHAKSTAALN